MINNKIPIYKGGIFVKNPKEPTEKAQAERKGSYVSEGMCLGMVIGMVLGSVTNHIPMGMTLGLCVGLAVGSARKKK
jgi:F0F1-type ATP synthase assembly protein I